MGWSRFFRRTRRDAELADELESYLAHEAGERITEGAAADDARHAALRKLGNPTRVRETVYETNSLAPVEALAKDLRYAARLLRRSPGFAIAAILSLALGIGANTAIFQLLDALRLRSLPIPRPHELVEVVVDGGNRGYGVSDSSNANLTNPLWEGLRDSQQAFAGLFVWGNAGLPVGRGSDLQFPRSIWVSGDFFPCLGSRAPARAAAGPLRRFARVRARWRRHQPRVLAARVWRPRRGGWRAAGDRRQGVPGGRRDTAGILRARGGPTLRHRAAGVRGGAVGHRARAETLVVADGDGTPQARMDPLAGGRARQGAERAAVRSECAHRLRRQLELEGAAVHGGSRRQGHQPVAPAVRDVAVAAARDHRAGAAGRLREPRQPDARACHRAPTRVRASPRAWRLSMAAGLAVADREPAPRLRRRHPWRCPCRRAEPHGRAVPDDEGQRPAPRSRARLAGACVHQRHRDSDVPHLRPGPSPAVNALPTGRGDEVRRPRPHRRPGALLVSARPGRSRRWRSRWCW